MTKLKREDPVVHRGIGDKFHVRLLTVGDTDDLWRESYNEVAKSVPAVASGTGNRTVIVVKLDEDSPFAKIQGALNLAMGALAEADKAARNKRTARSLPDNAVADWWRKLKENFQSWERYTAP